MDYNSLAAYWRNPNTKAPKDCQQAHEMYLRLDVNEQDYVAEVVKAMREGVIARANKKNGRVNFGVWAGLELFFAILPYAGRRN